MRHYIWRIAFLFLFTSAAPAHANALSDSWSCAKNAGLSSASVGKDLYNKGEALAKKAGPIAACLAQTGPEAQALMVTSSALTALRLAKPSLLPKNQCESRLTGLATKPFANGIAALMPSGNPKNKLLAVANSEVANDQVWSQIDQLPPPFSSVHGQIKCGCLLSDGALSLTDVTEITNAVANSSASCAAMLDTLGLGFINDVGSYAGKLAKNLAFGASDKWDQWVSGQSEPAPAGAVFQSYFGDHLDFFAERIAANPAGWQNDQTYHDVKSCQFVGPSKCLKNVNQITNECIDYYDTHKMSKSNATKACIAYRDTVVAAAANRAKLLVAMSQIPGLLDAQMSPWLKAQWLWRLPRTFIPGTYNYESAGSVSDPTKSDPNAQSLRNTWGDVLGSWKWDNGHVYGWQYDASGVYALALKLLPELGNDADKAVALTLAATSEPLRDKSRTIWANARKGYGLYQLREWYPTPAFGFRYGCPGNLEQACVSAVESRFEKSCFSPLSEHYLNGAAGIPFGLRLNQLSSTCKDTLQTVLGAAAKLDAAEDANIANSCSAHADRDAHAICVTQMQTSYRDCAAKALRDGKDDATQCLRTRMVGKSLLEQLQKAAKKGSTRPAPPPETPPSRKP